MHKTQRDLLRQWYRQIKQQSFDLTQNLRYIAAHTIVPADPSMSSFGVVDFVPLSQMYDVILHNETNISGNVVATSVRFYKSNYDVTTNKLTIGGANNFVTRRELKFRPFRGAKSRIFDPVSEPALLDTAMDMETERKAGLRSPSVLRTPRFAGALLAFTAANKPHYDLTPGLQDLVWASVQPKAEPMRMLRVPIQHNGKPSKSVKEVLRDRNHGVAFVALDNDYCVEIPFWAKILVKAGDAIYPNQPLVSLSMPVEVLRSIWAANNTKDDVWASFVSYLGEESVEWLMKAAWDDTTVDWAGMHLVPNYLVSVDKAAQAVAVWRDIRGLVGRSKRDDRNVEQMIGFEKREGRISAWNMGATSSPQTLKFNLLAGDIDLHALPSRSLKTRSINLTNLVDEGEPLPVLSAKLQKV